MSNKIMIVEDDPEISAYLRTIFEDNGYETSLAVSGIDAIKKVKEDTPDLITLDLMMPGSWGNVFYQKLQKTEELKDIPVIVISGADSVLPMGDIKKEKVMKLEKAAAFIKKPFDRDELLNKVSALLNN